MEWTGRWPLVLTYFADDWPRSPDRVDEVSKCPSGLRGIEVNGMARQLAACPDLQTSVETSSIARYYAVMPDYRRYFVPGGTFFFTVVTYERQPFLCTEIARRFLRESLKKEQKVRPYSIDAVVLLPDHLHMIWSLPSGDAEYPLRWKRIKERFTLDWLNANGMEASTTQSEQEEGRRGVWQPRYIEHTVRDEDDYVAHVDYIHYNPVKHGLVKSPVDWPWSSFHRYVRLGMYDESWGRGEMRFPNVDSDLLE